MRWTTGVTVGKFNPPHLGHAHLLQTALESVERLHVLVCERADQTLGGSDRAAWLANAVEAEPDRLIMHVTPDDLPETYEPWARRALAVLPTTPDVAFTSESYGPEWARAMGAEHIEVDRARLAQPVSGSALRDDLEAHFDDLVPAARAALCRRVVVVGAESTGKTTLARALAAELQTVWVPEHGRFYAGGRVALPDADRWASWEFTAIARAQLQMIADLGRLARCGWLIADTDALVTGVWHRRYLGEPSPVVDALAAENPPALYLVCAPDLPWVQDGTRESRAERQAMHADTLARVQDSEVPFAVVSGEGPTRLEGARAALKLAEELPALR